MTVRKDELARSNPDRSNHWSTTAFLIGLGIAATGIVVLTGWTFDVPSLTTVFPGLSSMKPNTAIGLVLAGTALCRISTAKTSRASLVGRIVAWIAAAIGVLTLTEYATGVDFAIDQIVMNDPYTLPTDHPGRMSIMTALCFVFFGVGTQSSSVKSKFGLWLFLGSITVGFLISFSAILGYVLSSAVIYNPFPGVSMAIHTAGAFLLAFIGLSATRPDVGFVALLRSRNAGGYSARRLLPMIFVGMPLIAWLRLQGEYAGLYDTETGLTLLTLIAVVVLGAVICLTGFHANRLDANLQVSEQRYRQVVDEIQEAIWVHHEGQVVFANPYAATMFGAESPESLVDLNMLDMVHPDDQEMSVARMAKIDEGIDVPPVEMKMRRLDGSTVYALVHAIRIPEQSDRYILSAARDITQQRETEEQLRQSQKMESIGRLTGGIAHDFNNLLTVIIGNAELLIESKLKDGQKSLADTIVKASVRGSELTKHMLAFSRRQPLQPKSIDASELLTGMEPMLRRTLGEDIELNVKGAEGLWPLTADPAQVESAILNLGVNARHALKDGGKLTLETANARLDEEYCRRNAEVTPGDYVMFAVTDTGTGMPPDVVKRAFEPFFTTKGPGKGTGLGLSMIFGFAKQSRGHVKIYSEVGEGTTVKLYLPRDTSQPTVDAAPAVRQKRAVGTETILLVEDDDEVRFLALRQLTAFGYRVIDAPDGPSALAKLASEGSIDLLFTDVILPGGMTGKQLADNVVAIRPNMRILYASGYTENAIIHQGRLDPGVLLLTKPYRSADLSHMVRKALDQS